MFSIGYFNVLVSLCEKAAYIIVKPPTRPKNISKINMICEVCERLVVIPRVSPTVPIAEKLTYNPISASFQPY